MQQAGGRTSSTRAVKRCSTLTCVQIIFLLKPSLCQAVWESLVSSRIFSAAGHRWQSYRSHVRVRCRRVRPKSLHQPLSQAGADLGFQTLGNDSMMLHQLKIHRQWRGPTPSCPRNHSCLGTLRTQPWAAAFYSLKHFLSCSFLLHTGASLVAQMVKNLPAVQETWVQSLGREDPLEERIATHSSILAWRIL